MDVAFLVDTSKGVSNLNFQREKNFVKTLVRSFTISSNLSRVGIISYGDKSEITVNFSDEQSTDSLIKRVDSIPILGGGPQIDQALEMAAAELFSPNGPSRAAVPRTVVIVTDCEKDPVAGPSRLDEAVNLLRKDGVKVLVVAVGCEREDEKKELEMLVEAADDMFTPDSFENLAAAAATVSAAAADFAGTMASFKHSQIRVIQRRALPAFGFNCDQNQYFSLVKCHIKLSYHGKSNTVSFRRKNILFTMSISSRFHFRKSNRNSRQF